MQSLLSTLVNWIVIIGNVHRKSKILRSRLPNYLSRISVGPSQLRSSNICVGAIARINSLPLLWWSSKKASEWIVVNELLLLELHRRSHLVSIFILFKLVLPHIILLSLPFLIMHLSSKKGTRSLCLIPVILLQESNHFINIFRIEHSLQIHNS